ncbi:MAG: response regulator transcription factor [Dehalococcoidia bacterium]
MTNALILAVDNEPAVLRLVTFGLREQGFRIMTTTDPIEALQICETQRPDIVLLDIMMPGVNGLELLTRLRERWSVPVIFLTARDRDSDKILGLQMGADDYVVKPFNPEELAARVHAVLRRGAGYTASKVVRVDGLEIDLDRRLVLRDGEAVNLTRTEWSLLQHLALNAGKVLLASELLSKVWGPEYRDDVQYLRVWILRLRRKIERDPSNPRLIRTFPGIGYRFEAEPPAQSA